MKYVLSDNKIRSLKPQAKAYKVADGGGLHILVSTTGTKAWRFNYRFAGSFKTLALGIFPAVSIKQARNDHADAIEAISQGIDPSAAKQNQKAQSKAQADSRLTFRQVAAKWLEQRQLKREQGDLLAAERAKAQGRDARAKKKNKTGDRDALNVGYLNADLGDKFIDELEVQHLAVVLDKRQAAGTYETRKRVQGTAVDIARYAHGKGIIKANPFAGTPFASAYIPASNIPRPAVTEPEPFGQLLRKIDHFEGLDGDVTRIALKLLALTAVRPGELAAALWSEFDFDDAKWQVPPEALKMTSKRNATNSDRAGKSHEVPLSWQALALLRELHKLTGHSQYLFPTRRPKSRSPSIHKNAFNNALLSLGYKDTHCAHGFRSSFSTIMNEQYRDVDGHETFIWENQDTLIEMQLDHNDASTRRIYARGGRYPHRAELMQHWADLIDRLRSGNTPVQKPRLVAVA